MTNSVSGPKFGQQTIFMIGAVMVANANCPCTLPRAQTLERQFLENRLLSNSQAWLPKSRAATPGAATA